MTLKTITEKLLNRIEKALEENEDHTQTDFGRSHGTEDNVSSILLRTLLVTVDREVHSRSLQVDPVHFRKTFESVEWTEV